MPYMVVKRKFFIELDPSEIQLIERALTGRMREEEKGEAMNLGNAFSVKRCEEAERAAHDNEKLRSSLVKAGLIADESITE